MEVCSLLSQTTRETIEIATDTTYHNAMWQVDIENRIGLILSKIYPNRQWYIDAMPDQGVLVVKCATISMDYGMTIHLTHNMIEVEKRAKAAAGELLERFELSRRRNASGVDDLDLKRDIRGQVLGAIHGEYTH